MWNNEKELDRLLFKRDTMMHKSITKEEFNALYPSDFILDEKFILSLLEQAYTDKNLRDLEYAFTVSGSIEPTTEFLCKLMVEDWHIEHEDIATTLQWRKDPKATETLYQAATMKFDYLAYNDSHAFARKCIYALGDINSAESIDKIRKLTQVNDETICGYATHQLERIGA